MNVILFVFGMGRSGTSALTRVLSLCGGSLPAGLVGATEGNPLGHWEPEDALALNQAFLAEHGASWFDPTLRLQCEEDFTSEESAAFIERIKAFLLPLSAKPLLVIKEPRVTALSRFWFEAARQLDMSVRIVVPVRHPAEVAASLAARDGASPELASALWLKYNLLGERESRPYPRVFVEYTTLLSDWRKELSRIASALSVDLSQRDESAVAGFLRQDLRRQRDRSGIVDVFGSGWVSRVHAALSAAARDEPVDTAVLDEIFDAYRGCERAFRVALGEFRARFTMDTQRNPMITRVIRTTAGGNSRILRDCINSDWYREQNPDVIASGCDPYEHWMAYGCGEGRLPSEDPLSLLERLICEKSDDAAPPAPVLAPPSPSLRLPSITKLIGALAPPDSAVLKSCLTSAWYVEQNPDLAAARVDPYEHWLSYGIGEGRLPCADPLSLLERLMHERSAQPHAG